MTRCNWMMLLLSLPMLAALLGLGTWQVQRLAWKTDLLAQLAATEAAPPVPLAATPAPYTKVAAEGRFDHAHEALLGVEVRNGLMGARLITPLLRDNAPPLLVDRGWVPIERGRAIDRPEGRVAVTGYVRPADTRDWNSPKDDPVGRRFYLFDPAAMGLALGLPAPAGYGLVALSEPGALGEALPKPARGLPRPDNPHLGYAITWYGLAVALVGVVVVFLFRRNPEAHTEP